ncbi:amino acid ABC transporter substrate-binding protein [Magnetospira sp. QH-2]|uniref:amino acid ABC transporter substrate-binding protein n=1 Tax=Magnetospira sp. (strain QH-2) TaxID=1288970 RepID=UPI0003E80D8F|nr:amino acid ABC transporter substrate-binding protein [Magnetospira sp. QH-2]CCQ74137.1 Amino-acid transporter subunit. Periplasmic-binding component of ABC superfamily [Magnetospira sp. QH-2]
MNRLAIAILCGSLFLIILRALPVAADTLDDVRSRGFVVCGVAENHQGFARLGEGGQWEGIDVDFCRAVAAAVLGDAGSVQFHPLGPSTRFEALRSGEIDLLIRSTTWNLSRDADMPFHFAGVTYFDGQGFLALKSLGAEKIADLDHASVCVAENTTTHQNIVDMSRRKTIAFDVHTFRSWEGQFKAFFNGRCDLISDDRSGLISLRHSLAPDPQAYVLLDDIISKEPLGPVVREDSPAWFDIVKWVVNAVIGAEELGVNSKNVDQMTKDPTSAEMARLLGVEGNLGQLLGLDAQWAKRVIAQVGNYGEVFARNLGEDSPLKTKRGLNRQWRDGGLLYAMPFN